MRLSILSVPALLLFSCDGPSTEQAGGIAAADGRTTVVFRVPDDADAVRLLWQRSYPEDHAALIARARQARDDPFSPGREVPDSELTPGTFGRRGWDRAIVPRAFDALGHPLGNGAEAALDHRSGSIRVTHSPAAIDAFRARFPEFGEIREREAGEGEPTAGPGAE